MGLKDYTDSHVGVAVAATAIVCSPRMREMLRRGAVHGVAGALMAGDAVASFARGVGRGAQQAAASAPASASAVVEAQDEVDNADASMNDNGSVDDGSADAPAQADEKGVGKTRHSRTKAHADEDGDDDIALVEADSDE